MADHTSKIPELRQAFLTKYSGSILDDTYDERDVSWVKEDDRFLKAVLDTFRASGDTKKGCDILNDVLLFRAKFKLNDMTEDDIHPYFKEHKGIFYHGEDKLGRTILVFTISKAKKGELVEEGKKFIAFRMNEYYRRNPHKPILVLYDFVNAGISNMDMEISKFLTEASRTYFPNMVGFSLMFKMSKPLEAIWKIIMTFLDSDQKKRVKFVKRSNIQEHIDREHLLEHMVKEENK